MPVRTDIHGSEDRLFITFTCYKWLPLIEITNSYDLVYKWFDYLKTKGHLVAGYVVMPDHVHALIYFSKTQKPINKIVADGKRFMAYKIVKRVERTRQRRYSSKIASCCRSQRQTKRKKA
jgi:REP element-mobilizing transposase RayT